MSDSLSADEAACVAPNDTGLNGISFRLHIFQAAGAGLAPEHSNAAQRNSARYVRLVPERIVVALSVVSGGQGVTPHREDYFSMFFRMKVTA